MAILKNTFVWIMAAVIAVALAHTVVKRPKPGHVPPAIVAVEAPKTYTEFREAHEPPERVPPVAAPEPAKVAVESKPRPRGAASKIGKHKPTTRVMVKPESGANAVSVPCPKLKGYVEKYGRDRVVMGAQAYGYSSGDAEHALKACNL